MLQAFLIDGMESQSQAKVGSALQVFFNLEELNRVGVVAMGVAVGCGWGSSSSTWLCCCLLMHACVLGI